MIFICSTPFHLLTALNLKLNKYSNKHCALVMLDHSGNNQLLYDKVVEIGIFEENRFFNTNHLRLPLKSNRLMKAIKGAIYFKEAKEIYRKWPLENVYKKIFIPYPDYITYAIAIDNDLKNSSSTEIAFYDEGLYSYTDFLTKNNSASSTNFKNLLGKVIYHFDLFSRISELWLYEPNLSDVVNPNIKKMKLVLHFNDKQLSMVNNIFDYKPKEDSLKSFDIIYLEQPFRQEQYSYKIKQLIDNYINHNNIKDCVIKLHPRTTKNFDERALKTPYPIELLYLNNKMDDKTIITVSSSGAYNAYIMFNRKPKVIFADNTYSESFFKHFILKLSNQFDNFYSPTSEQELLSCLEALPKKNKPK